MILDTFGNQVIHGVSLSELVDEAPHANEKEYSGEMK